MGVRGFRDRGVLFGVGGSAGRGGTARIRVVRGDATGLRKRSWAASRDGPGEHAGQGGSFRRGAVLRGATDADEAQGLLASTALHEALPCPETHRLLPHLPSAVGGAPPEMHTPARRRAHALPPASAALPHPRPLETLLCRRGPLTPPPYIYIL